MPNQSSGLIAYYFGAYALAGAFAALVPVFYWVASRGLGAGAGIIDGADNRPSTSKFQFWLWTVVIVFAYAAIYFARLLKHGFYYAIDEIPVNLLIAMGLNAVTATAAKGITVSYVNSGQIAKPPADPGTSGFRYVFLDDQKRPDLSKIQMMTWTFLAIAIYLIIVGYQVDWIIRQAGGLRLVSLGSQLIVASARYSGTEGANALNLARIALPDISPALMVLMGLGQGAYLGTKLVSIDTPRLIALDPARGLPLSTLKISGQAIGIGPDVCYVTINGQRSPTPAKVDGPGEISFQLPATQPNGTSWPAQRVALGVFCSGQQSANELPFDFLQPSLLQMEPAGAKPGTMVTGVGDAFGTAAHRRTLLIDGTPYPDVPVSLQTDPTRVQFPFPAKKADGTDWAPPTTVQISITVQADGYTATTGAVPFNVQ